MNNTVLAFFIIIFSILTGQFVFAVLLVRPFNRQIRELRNEFVHEMLAIYGLLNANGLSLGGKSKDSEK